MELNVPYLKKTSPILLMAVPFILVLAEYNLFAMLLRKTSMAGVFLVGAYVLNVIFCAKAFFVAYKIMASSAYPSTRAFCLVMSVVNLLIVVSPPVYVVYSLSVHGLD